MTTAQEGDPHEPSTLNKPMRILLVDDHPLVNQGLKTLLCTTEDLFLYAAVSSAHEVMAEVERRPPDLLILDLSLSGTSGLDILKDLHIRHPSLKVLVLSMHEEDVYAERALKAGAMGYIMKQETGPEIIRAIRTVLGGSLYTSRAVEASMLKRFIAPQRVAGENRGPEMLDDRELQVFAKIGDGFSTKQIADCLHLSPKTIQTYRDRIKKKLGLHHACELIHSATRWVKDESIG